MPKKHSLVIPPPSRLRPGDMANFETLQRAQENGDLCLVAAVRRADLAQVALVCAMGYDAEKKLFLPAPLAVVVEGDPCELFFDPTEGR